MRASRKASNHARRVGAAEGVALRGGARTARRLSRMAAGPGSKVCGRLSVMLQAYCQVTSLFVVPPGAFRPPPKVDSAVVRLVPRDPATININDHRRFADVVKAAFGQRRKMLRSSLKGVAPGIEEHLIAAGIAPTARAQEIPVQDFCALARQIAQA